MGSIVEHPSSVAQQNVSAPTLSTDRPGASMAPPAATPSSGSYPDESYRGWASL